MTFKFLDVVTILLNYCGPKLAESDNKEMKAVIRDLIVIIGYFCANNRRNQVRKFTHADDSIKEQYFALSRLLQKKFVSTRM